MQWIYKSFEENWQFAVIKASDWWQLWVLINGVLIVFSGELLHIFSFDIFLVIWSLRVVNGIFNDFSLSFCCGCMRILDWLVSSKLAGWLISSNCRSWIFREHCQSSQMSVFTFSFLMIMPFISFLPNALVGPPGECRLERAEPWAAETPAQEAPASVAWATTRHLPACDLRPAGLSWPSSPTLLSLLGPFTAFPGRRRARPARLC